MRFYVYLIISKNLDKYTSYVGYTKNIKKRLELHNKSKGAKFTRGKKWILAYCKSYKNKSIAMPVYVCSSLRNAVAMAQAIEVLIDNATDSPNICLNQLQKSNADIAIVPHMFGLPNEIQNIKDIDIIEDCAQSL